MADQDPALGSLSSGQLLGDSGSPWPTPTPGSDPGAGAPPPRGRPPWLPVLVIGLVAVVAIVMVAGAAILLLSGGEDSPHAPPVTRSDPGTENHGGGRDVQPAQPERPSPYSEKAVREGLRKIRRAAKGRPAFTLRVDATGITAIVSGKVLVYRDGDVQTLPGPPETSNTFDLGKVDPAAPGRIYKGVREKGKTLDYMAYVSNAAFSDDMWAIAANQGTAYFRADRSGRNLKPSG